MLRPNVGQKEPPRLGSTICYGQELARKSHRAICYGQELARKSHRDSAVRFVAAKNLAIKRATKTRQYDLLRPRLGQKEPPRLGSTICYGQELARRSHQDSAVRFVTAKSWTERATKTRQYDLLRRRVNKKEPPRPANTIRYGQKWARKNHQDSAVRFVTAKCGPRVGQNDSAIRFVTAKSGPQRGIKIRQFVLYGQEWARKKPPRLGNTMCYSQECARKSHQDSALRFVTAKTGPERATKTRQAVRFVTAKSGPERAAKIRQYDMLRPRMGQKEPPRLGSTLCYGQNWARKNHQDLEVRLVTAKTVCYGQEWARESHQDTAVGFNTLKSGPGRTAKTRQYDTLRPKVGQIEPPRLGSTTKNHQDPGLQFSTAKNRLVTWARKSFQDQAVRFITARSGPERDTKTRQEDLLRPRVTRKSNQNPEIRFGIA